MPHTDAFFLPFLQGRRFCLLHAPEPAMASRGAILYIHPFAEEMNRSRRMAAVQARAFAAAGWAVLQVDLFGCGDSEGDFGGASWTGWVSDVSEALAWLRTRFGTMPVLWGLRTGCLLATAAAREMGLEPDMLFWQPVTSGKQFLRQFLRVKLAGQIISGEQDDHSTLRDFLAGLQRGEALEIAGYELSPALAAGLGDAVLALPATAGRLGWLEVASEDTASLTPAARDCLAAWRSAGIRATERVVAGPPFWQLQDITESPALLDATMDITEAWRG